MKGKQSLEEGRILVNAEILKSANISIDDLQEHLIELKSILGEKLELVVSPEINNLPALQSLISLSQCLRKLKQCEGFDKHIKNYTKNQLQSSYFVTVIASYLFDKVDSIIMEPPITATKRASDILANLRGEQVYLECKRIDTAQFDYYIEHEHMFSTLSGYINVPHQIDITYNKSLSDEELYGLGKTLQERINQITGDGTLIHNANLKVGVQIRKAYAGKGIAGILVITTKDLHTNCYYPGHVYIRDGKTLSLCGPEVDFIRVLKDKIRKSRHQSPPDSPYILVIDGNNMLGDLSENIRALELAFQPTTNTRFSAAILVTYYLRFETSCLDFNFYLVTNPFAKFTISEEFKRLFNI